MKFIERLKIDYRRRVQPDWVQINLGYRCNQRCQHCHIGAGPERTEVMAKSTMERILLLIDHTASIQQIDLTGGAPELHPHFRFFIEKLYHRGRTAVVRTNLTVLLEPEQEGMIDFFRQKKVKLVASLPCYSKENVDAQRGDGVFEKSVSVLKKLNAAGYGVEGRGLELDLVYNPRGAFLPGSQTELESEYKRVLWEDHAIRFNHLRTINNVPINRFKEKLERENELEAYEKLLINNFNEEASEKIMCRRLVSVNWKGELYDCDFNQMLNIPLGYEARHVDQLETFNDLKFAPIAFGKHCYACTAGAGSSCGGALV